MTPIPQKILFYDGDCAMCNHAVLFVMKRMGVESVFFSPLQSEFAKKHIPESYNDIDAIILKDGDDFYIKTDVFIALSKINSSKFNFLGLLRYIPKTIRDAVYDFIARNRKHFQSAD